MAAGGGRLRRGSLQPVSGRSFPGQTNGESHGHGHTDPARRITNLGPRRTQSVAQGGRTRAADSTALACETHPSPRHQGSALQIPASDSDVKTCTRPRLHAWHPGPSSRGGGGAARPQTLDLSGPPAVRPSHQPFSEGFMVIADDTGYLNLSSFMHFNQPLKIQGPNPHANLCSHIESIFNNAFLICLSIYLYICQCLPCDSRQRPALQQRESTATALRAEAQHGPDTPSSPPSVLRPPTGLQASRCTSPGGEAKGRPTLASGRQELQPVQVAGHQCCFSCSP